jgi:hypothetical protein
MATVESLAETICVDPADLLVVLRTFEVQEDGITPDVITAVHRYLNPNRERTVPELYIPEIDSDWRD